MNHADMDMSDQEGSYGGCIILVFRVLPTIILVKIVVNILLRATFLFLADHERDPHLTLLYLEADQNLAAFTLLDGDASEAGAAIVRRSSLLHSNETLQISRGGERQGGQGRDRVIGGYRTYHSLECSILW